MKLVINIYTILVSFLVGVVGMGVGGVVTALFGSRTDKMTSIFLSFAGGVMISIVFLELLPEAIEMANLMIGISGLILGAALVFILNGLMDRLSTTRIGSKLHDTYADFFHSSDVITRKSSMLRSGIIMIFAIALHNIPEGLAMGTAGFYDTRLGFTLAIAIALHNIPEGMAVTAPLIVGGLSRMKSIVITMLAGATTVIGAIAGVLIGGISEVAVAISFAMAGGAMLYVVLGEILPQSIVTSKDRLPTIFTLVGIIIGVIIIELLH